MINKYWILFIALFSNIGIVVEANACGPRKPDVVNFEMLDPLVFPDSTYRPFYYEPHNPYYDQGDAMFSQIGMEQNLQEWQTFLARKYKGYFGWDYRKDEVKAAIYQYEIDELKSKEGEKFCQFLQDNQPVMNYLVFAKQCEEAISSGDPWSDQKRNYRAVKEMIPKAKKSYQSVSDSFLRFRYAYQMVLLARYSKQHQKAIHYFNDYLKPIKQEGPLYFWALHHKAYCHLKRDEPVKANLASGEVFGHSPAKRLRAFLYLKNEKVEAALDRKELSDNKAARLLAIKNLMNRGPAIEAMKQIYKADPQNKTLRFLAVREVNKWETNIYTKSYKKLKVNFSYTIEKQIENDRKHLSELIDFLATVIEEQKVGDIDYWQLLRGHALMISGQYEQAKAQLNYVNKDELTNPNQKIQLEKTRLIAKTYTSKLDQEFDNYVHHKLTWLKTKKQALNNFKSQIGHLALFLGKYYEQNGQLPKAVMFYNYAIMKGRLHDIEHQYMVSSGRPDHTNVRYPYYFYYLDNHATAWQVQDFLDVLQKDEPNNLVAMLLKPLHYDLNRVKDLKATIHFRQDEVRQSYQTLKTIPDSFWMRRDMPYINYLYNNPFARNNGYYLESYSNFYGNDTFQKDSIRYTKVEMVEQLLEYRRKAHAGKNPAYHYFKLGNAYANFSYSGKDWLMYIYLKSDNHSYQHMKGKPFFDHLFHLDKAEKYYRKAYKAATNKRTKAFLARVTLDAQLHGNYYASNNGEPGYTKAPYYKVLKKNHPDEVEELVKDPHSYHSYLKEAF